jgi:hypothetical protein
MSQARAILEAEDPKDFLKRVLKAGWKVVPIYGTRYMVDLFFNGEKVHAIAIDCGQEVKGISRHARYLADYLNWLQRILPWSDRESWVPDNWLRRADEQRLPERYMKETGKPAFKREAKTSVFAIWPRDTPSWLGMGEAEDPKSVFKRLGRPRRFKLTFDFGAGEGQREFYLDLDAKTVRGMEEDAARELKRSDYESDQDYTEAVHAGLCEFVGRYAEENIERNRIEADDWAWLALVEEVPLDKPLKNWQQGVLETEDFKRFAQRHGRHFSYGTQDGICYVTPFGAPAQEFIEGLILPGRRLLDGGYELPLHYLHQFLALAGEAGLTGRKVNQMLLEAVGSEIHAKLEDLSLSELVPSQQRSDLPGRVEPAVFREGWPKNMPPLFAFRGKGEISLQDGHNRHSAALAAGLRHGPVVTIPWEVAERLYGHGMDRLDMRDLAFKSLGLSVKMEAEDPKGVFSQLPRKYKVDFKIRPPGESWEEMTRTIYLRLKDPAGALEALQVVLPKITRYGMPVAEVRVVGVQLLTSAQTGQSAAESVADDIAKEADKAEKPTEKEKEAGNYKKGHIRLHGFEIAIENAKGSTRSGVDDQGKKWSIVMPAVYGYINGTVGKDKDHIDVYIGEHPTSMLAFVVNQHKKEGGFDEHKIMMGFKSKDEAIATYDAAFNNGLGPKLRKSVISATVDQLKHWLEKGDPKKEYANLEEAEDPKGFLRRLSQLTWTVTLGGFNSFWFVCDQHPEY